MASRTVHEQMMRGRRKTPHTALWWIIGGMALVILLVFLAVQDGGSSEAVGGEGAGDSGGRSLALAQSQDVQGNDVSGEGDAAASSDGGADDSSGVPGGVGSSGANAGQQARSQELLDSLNALAITSGRSGLDYDRGLFGQSWYDYDRNGCDTRNDILGRDLIDVQFKADTNGCKVLEGTLNDWYSGTTVHFVSGQDTSRLVQVDHVVPLSWAWHHGADAWDDETRLKFANDPMNLNATTDVENQSKSDSGPSRWLPTDEGGTCRYVERFLTVLDEYQLGIGVRDRAMMRGVLLECAQTDYFGEFEGT